MQMSVLFHVLSLALAVIVFSNLDDPTTATVLYPADSPWDVSANPVQKIVSSGNIHIFVDYFIFRFFFTDHYL